MSQHTYRLTEKAISLAKTEAELMQTPKFIWCKELRGFGLRIAPSTNKYPNGKASYLVQKHVAGRNSREIRYTFGEFPNIPLTEAYNLAITHLAQIRNNIDPSHKRKQLISKRAQEYQAQKTNKFPAVFENYRQSRIEEAKSQNKNLYYFEKDIVYSFNLYVLPRFKTKTFPEITKEDIKHLLKDISMRSKSHAKKIEAQLKPLWKYAIYEDIIKSNPFDALKPLPKVKSRERVLTKEELKAIWLATQELINTPKPIFGYMYRLLILSAARLTEISGLEHTEINHTEKYLDIKQKGNKPHIVPLSDFAIDLLNSIPKKHQKYAFSYGVDALSGFSAAKKLLDKRVKHHLPKDYEFVPWRNHDFRKTFATIMASQNCNPDIIDRCLGHTAKSQEGVRGIYQKWEFVPERRHVMQTWSNFIEKLIQE